MRKTISFSRYLRVPPRNERLRRALPLKPSHLEGIYVVYNNEIDLTWWQCHVPVEEGKLEARRRCRNAIKWYEKFSSPSIHPRLKKETGVMYCWERFIPDGINQTEQVFYHSLRYTKMKEIQSASRQQFPCAISPSADDSKTRENWYRVLPPTTTHVNTSWPLSSYGPARDSRGSFCSL